jgi:hypothetical protein
MGGAYNKNAIRETHVQNLRWKPLKEGLNSSDDDV